MKKILILIFSLMISFNSYGEKSNNLFGINLNDNAEKYASSYYIDNNKLLNTETLGGYFDLEMTDQIKSKSPYASFYEITIDSNNKVLSIFGSDFISNINTCLEIQKDLSKSIEKKYQISFNYWEDSYPGFKKYQNYYHNSSGSLYSLQCFESHDDDTILFQIYMMSEEFLNALNEYYDSGL